MRVNEDSNRVIVWFRQDLRIADNPALYRASALGRVVPVYILDDGHAGAWRLGGAAHYWLHHSLIALNRSLGGALRVFSGDPIEIIPELARHHSARAVFWNRCYEPWRIDRDRRVKSLLAEHDVECRSFNGSLLWEPWEVVKEDGGPYRVFTPFYRRACAAAPTPRSPLGAPIDWSPVSASKGECGIDGLGLLPGMRWDRKLESRWLIGEAAAHQRLDAFLELGLSGYRQGRDYPALSRVSRLSPYLRWGQLSPNQVRHAAMRVAPSDDQEHFLRELGWREFSYHLLYHFPDLPETSLQTRFNTFPWRRDERVLRRWQQGNTGFPIVDAGMRELWQTGYMHNRVRMLVGSFLVKNLLLHWRDGERWFWDCLLDADLASNSASWQWVAGSGADAAPFFRIFNPVTQGEKFDPEGIYTRRYVPELREMPDRYLFRPWAAPAAQLEAAGVSLGKTYPEPIVDLKLSRERALAAFSALQS